MKKKVISLLLISAMTASMVAGCGDSSSSDTQKGDSKSATTVDDGHTLTVWAWDASFNIPALQAAADDYKANVDKDNLLKQIPARWQKGKDENCDIYMGFEVDNSFEEEKLLQCSNDYKEYVLKPFIEHLKI